MPGQYTTPLALGFAGFRLAACAFLIVLVWRLWARPSARGVAAGTTGLALVATCAYLAPLERSYGLGVASDRSFALGMAAGVAEGLSPFEHTQKSFGAPEPLWNWAFAAASGFSIDRLPGTFVWMSLLSVLAAALALAPRGGDDDAGAWEAALAVFALFALASFSLHARPPSPPLFTANFLLKPNHAFAFALIPLVLNAIARGSGVAAGAVFALLAWVFLVHWGYLVAVLVLYAFAFGTDRKAALRTVATTILIGAIAAFPFVRHLLADYAPQGAHGAATHMWSDARGAPLAVPNFTLLDPGLLVPLGLLGARRWWRRGSSLDRVRLALFAGAWLLFAGSIPASLLGVAPEPDELHFFVRFATAVAAGSGLAGLGEWLDAGEKWPRGRGALACVALLAPLSFFVYFDPPMMDRYYREGVEPLRPRVIEYATWPRENARPTDVFVAGPEAATFIPVFSGRRVYLHEAGALRPRDFDRRVANQKAMFAGTDAERVRAAREAGARFLVLDEPTAAALTADERGRLDASSVLRPRFRNAVATIYEFALP